MAKLHIHDAGVFIKAYPHLTKTLPPQAAEVVPDHRKIMAFLKLGGTVEGVTVVTANEPPASQPKQEPEQKAKPGEGKQPGEGEYANPEAAAIAASLRPAFLRDKITNYTVGRTQKDDETTRDFHRRCQLEYDAEQKAALLEGGQ